MNLVRHALASGLACLICGCGTVNNLVGISYFGMEPDLPGGRRLEYVYGGVKFDAMVVSQAFTKEADVSLLSRIFCLLFIADLPLSAVLDTLYLPLTIPEAERDRKVQEFKWAEFDDEGNQLPATPPGPAADAASETN